MADVEFGGNMQTFEMSRYIDLDLYHAVERTHPYYVEMIDEIQRLLGETSNGSDVLKAWEFGAGTGLATEEFIKHENLVIDALDLDSDCKAILESHIAPKAAGRVNFILGDATTYKGEEPYDVVMSVFAHDHIPYEKGEDLAKNISDNLKPGGLYIIGGELLPFYTSEEERQEALHLYHGFIVSKALRDGYFELAQIEINALKSGLEKIGDFKRHEEQFEQEMLSQGFKMHTKTKLGPVDKNDVGGVFVYAFEKQ
ncbi:MAG: class I SAM-dependent methyltransferase [Magnetovibrio sp.]|nr:class I SAM-dependent methyltransferase [Magnetovibrio sp.]